MLELYYKFFSKFCDVSKFKDLEMDTDSLYLALAEMELEDCIRPEMTEMKTEWEQLRSKDCSDSFTADVSGNFFPRMCCGKHKNTTRENPDLSKNNAGEQGCYVSVARRTAAMMLPRTTLNSVAKASTNMS